MRILVSLRKQTQYDFSEVEFTSFTVPVLTEAAGRWLLFFPLAMVLEYFSLLPSPLPFLSAFPLVGLEIFGASVFVCPLRDFVIDFVILVYALLDEITDNKI